MTVLQKNTLNGIIGKPKSYNGRNITINKFVPGDGFVTVHATGGNMNLNDDEIDAFLRSLGEPLTRAQLSALNEAEVSQNNTGVPESPGDNTVVPEGVFMKETGEVTTILMEALRKVKADPSFIPQAKSITEITGSIVEVQKVQLQAVQMARKFNKS